MSEHRTPEDFVGNYGPDWRRGVLTDHEAAFEAAGGRIRTLASGRRQVAVAPDGSTVPVVCGDIVEISTEDGPMSGRCGEDAVPGRYACEGHADARDAWMAMSPIEQAAQERREEEYAR